MGAVSYPDKNVIDFINEKIVPLRVPADQKPIADDFRVTWTPTLVSLDFYGREHQRTVGFLPPEQLIPSLLLGIAKVALDGGQYNEAVLELNRLLKTYPKSAVAPEAVYLRGVSQYKSSHNAGSLKEAHETLKAQYPESEWVHRSHPYSLL